MNSDRLLRLGFFTVAMMTMVGMSLLWQSKSVEPQAMDSQALAPEESPVGGSSSISTASPSPVPINAQAPNTEAYQVPQAERLHAYQKISDKVFASNEEEAQRKSMLRDRKLIEDMGAFLLDRRRFVKMGDQYSQQMEKDQDSAVDFLLEALKNGDKSFAEKTILNVVKDNQVEDTSLSMDQREALAGLKGELLFHGSAIHPQGFQNIQSILPGPVSLRIWQNVQHRQTQYAEESMEAKVAHDQKFGMSN